MTKQKTLLLILAASTVIIIVTFFISSNKGTTQNGLSQYINPFTKQPVYDLDSDSKNLDSANFTEIDTELKTLSSEAQGL